MPTIETIANLPTIYGNFKIITFKNIPDKKEHIALVKGDLSKYKTILVRIHSECLTGDVFHSLRCDCNQQLQSSLELISQNKTGVLLYMRHEGRGIGLNNKIKAYALQDQGLDTFEANQALGFKDDERDYQIAAQLLKSLKINSVELITNNPQKIEDLKKSDIKVVKRVPLIIEKTEHNTNYLQTKKTKGGHLL